MSEEKTLFETTEEIKQGVDELLEVKRQREEKLARASADEEQQRKEVEEYRINFVKNARRVWICSDYKATYEPKRKKLKGRLIASVALSAMQIVLAAFAFAAPFNWIIFCAAIVAYGTLIVCNSLCLKHLHTYEMDYDKIFAPVYSREFDDNGVAYRWKTRPLFTVVNSIVGVFGFVGCPLTCVWSFDGTFWRLALVVIMFVSSVVILNLAESVYHHPFKWNLYFVYDGESMQYRDIRNFMTRLNLK